jgi:arylsulfatase A-like enzyme
MSKLKTAIGFGLAAAIPAAAMLLVPEKSKPNVILILLDDFGYMDLGCYGSQFHETPNIDRLAAQGVRFTDAYAACPVSSPTRAALMTGRYPVRSGITDWIPGRQASNSGSPNDKFIARPFTLNLSLDETTIAELLKKNGYTTMISGKWHLGEDSIYWPEHQGFDINRGGYSKGAPVRNKNAQGFFSPYGNPRLKDGPSGEYLTDRLTDEVISFIRAKKDKPFFVYLSHYATHNPMQAKEEHINKFREKAVKMGLDTVQPFTRNKDWIRPGMSDNYKERVIQSLPVYAAMTWSVDENIGRLMAALDELGITENTIILFTSDNGGLSTSEGSPTCNSPLRAGKGWLYEGGIRVPMIVKYPGKSKPGTVIHTPVSSVDFLPTIAEMTGTSFKSGTIDGVSFVKLFTADEMNERPLFWHYPHYSNQGVEPGSAVRLGKYKLIDNFERERQELYDLAADPSETKDLAADNPAKTNELYSILKKWREENKAKMMDANPKWEPYQPQNEAIKSR